MGDPPVVRQVWRVERLTGDDDLAGVLEVEAESFTRPWTRDMYFSELRNPGTCHIYVARAEDCRVVGFCAFRIVVDEVHVNNMGIRPAWRGRGAGTVLLRHVFLEAERLGAPRATLEVRASNAGARRFYERLGFRVVATRRGYYTHPVEDALLLWREPS